MVLYKCIQSIKPQDATVTTRTQTEKNVNIDLEVRIENSMLKNRVYLLQREVDHLNRHQILILLWKLSSNELINTS